ncbi:MAG TPA: dockerin type I repeat-containing protein [Phycisphaerae bacterium]|nr:dockerin type I repeat-containing protein [Phycisphaerae bacterium]
MSKMQYVRRTVLVAICLCLCSGFSASAFGQGQVCPLPPGNQLCAPLQAAQCQSTVPGLQCRPTRVVYSPNAAGLVHAVECQCVNDSGVCGPVSVVGDFVRCPGFCPVPPPGNECRVFANGQPTGQTQVIFTQYPIGTEFTCDCQAIDPPPCEPDPNPAVLGCLPHTCPTPSETCKPRCILLDFQGLITVTDCECTPDPQPGVQGCHVAPPDAVNPEPYCVGDCPPGFTCFSTVTTTPNGTLYCCECRPDPPECVPTSDRQNCVNFVCPGPVPPIDQCKPRCVRYQPGTPFYEVLECDCRNPQECHVEIGAVGTVPHCEGGCPPGQVCVTNEVQNGDGTITICCDCIDPTCECLGDVDGNGILNAQDIAGFVRCFLGNPLPTDNCTCADMDENGVYTAVDINLFVMAILSKSKCFDDPCCPQTDLDLDIGSGVDDNGNLIPVGQDDDDTIVTLDASGGTVPRPATVVTPHPFWNTIPGTQWVSATYFGPNGDYQYKFCFCLDPRAKNPVFTIQSRADDAGQVYLNGNLLGNTGGFSDVNPTTLSTNNPNHFIFGGENCVTINVQNIGGAPTGVNYLANITAVDGACCCPPQDLDKSLNTGVDDNGNFIGNGLDDDDWVVVVDASGGFTPRPATVITNIHPLWDTVPGTQWISANQNGPNGLYVYQYCFCLDPRFKNPVLTLDVLADDYAQLFLNGNPIGATPNGWAFQNPPTHIVVTNPGFFRACENCIEVHVLNSGGPPTGLNIGGSIVAEDGRCCDDRPLSCCTSDGFCIDLPPGTTTCPTGEAPFEGPCGPPQACCLPDGSCQTIDPRCCEQRGGTVMPAGQTCSPQPQACCIDTPNGQSCIVVDPLCCVVIYNGVVNPAFNHCADTDGDGIPNACQPPPDQCEVDPLTGRCRQSHCPNPNHICQPKCVRVDPATGQVLAIEVCECMPTSKCHAELTPPPVVANCFGNCPAPQICQRTITPNPDGTETHCCECVDPPPTVCPLSSALGSQMCAQRQQADCQLSGVPNETCHPRTIITNGPGQGIFVEQCDCVTTGEPCGPIDVQPAATQGDFILRCVGPCGPDAGCNVFVNNTPMGPQVNTATLPAGSTVRCQCFIP